MRYYVVICGKICGLLGTSLRVLGAQFLHPPAYQLHGHKQSKYVVNMWEYVEICGPHNPPPAPCLVTFFFDSIGNVGCGGLWQGVVEENGTKMEKNGMKHPCFTVPFSQFSRRSKIFPKVPFVKISSAPTDGKMRIFATGHHGS